jgi:hypothetical protein
MPNGERRAEWALAHNAIFLDVDVTDELEPHPKDPDNRAPVHLTVVEAILLFCQSVKLPNPTVLVGSGGGGGHPYWVNIDTLLPDDWKPYATALRELAKKYPWPKGVKVDFSLTTDAARVLRLPGSENNKEKTILKYGAPRRVLFVPEASTWVRYNFPKTFAAIEETKVKQPKKGPLPLGAEDEEFKCPPLPFEPIKAGCAWLRDAYETGGAAHDEPQWHAALACAVFMENGNELAYAFGNQHPGFGRESTDDKFERKVRERDDKKLRWRTCKNIQECGSKFCGSCPHFAVGKTPLHLALPFVQEQQKDEETNAFLEEVGATWPPEELCIPRPKTASDVYYVMKEDSLCQICREKRKPYGLYLAELIISKMSNVVLRKDGLHHGISFDFVTDQGNVQNAFVKLYEFNAKTLKEKNVICRDENNGLIVKLGESWSDVLRRNRRARDVVTIGWRYEDGERVGFVFGNTFYGTDNSITASGLATNDEVLKSYQPKGRIEPWYRAAKLLTDRKRVELDILLVTGFAAPLMAFAGTIYGSTLSIWGEAGTSKSTTQQVACAVWAHPKFGRESLQSTHKSVLNKMGMIRNLPAFWDDIQDEIKQEQLFQATFILTEGMEGSRLNTDITQRERKEWQTLMVVCSNASYVDFVIKKQPSTDAGIRRIFEYKLEKKEEVGLIDAFDATKAFAELEHNYGRIGEAYVKILVAEHEKIDALVDETVKRFRDRVDGTPKENYWWGVAGVLIAGAHMAKRMGVEVDPDQIEEFLVGVFMDNRKLGEVEGTEGGSKDNTWNALVHFLTEYIGRGHALFRRGQDTNADAAIAQPMPGRPLYIDVLTEDHALIISKKAFRDYLNEQQIQRRPVLLGLVKHFDAKTDNRKATLGKNTHWRVGQQDVIEIPISRGSPLEELLWAHTKEPTSEA